MLEIESMFYQNNTVRVALTVAQKGTCCINQERPNRNKMGHIWSRPPKSSAFEIIAVI